MNTDAVAKRQLQLEASKYRDYKTEEIKTNLKDFAEKLQGVRKIGAQLARRLERQRANAPTTAAFIAAASEEPTVIESFDKLTEAFDALSRSILQLASNEIVHAAVEGQRGATDNKIRAAIQGFWGDGHKFDFNRDILDIREQIDFLQQERTVEDAAAAFLLMPPDYHSLDFLGAVIKAADKDDQLATDRLKDQSLAEGDEILNYGLALVASLYQLLPSDQMISDTIARLYNIGDLRLRPAAQFKAREVYFSRSHRARREPGDRRRAAFFQGALAGRRQRRRRRLPRARVRTGQSAADRTSRRRPVGTLTLTGMEFIPHAKTKAKSLSLDHPR